LRLLYHKHYFWKRLLARQLPELGHRNLIGVVDAAYPLQTSAGIETIVTGASDERHR